MLYQFFFLHTSVTSSNLKINLEVPTASGKLSNFFEGVGVMVKLNFNFLSFEALSTLCSGPRSGSTLYPTISLAYLD